jgi:hypothetical protein
MSVNSRSCDGTAASPEYAGTSDEIARTASEKKTAKRNATGRRRLSIFSDFGFGISDFGFKKGEPWT